MALQRQPVRASSGCYPAFTLPMGSSPGFGSTPCDYDALFGLAFAAAPAVTALTSPQRVTPRLILQEARRQAFPARRPGIALRLFVGTRFQVLFHSPHRGSFHLSLTVLVHYRSPRVFSLGWWSTQLPTGFHVPRGTRGYRRETGHLSRTGLSPSMAGLSRPFR